MYYGGVIKITANNIQLSLTDNAFSVEGIFVLSDGAKICADCEQEFLIRTLKAVSDPVYMSRILSVEKGDNQVSYRLCDYREEYLIDLTICSANSGIRYFVKAEAPVPIWLVEWKMTGFEFERVLVPALGGQALEKSMQDGTVLSYKYPFWWNAQFVIGELNEGSLLLDGRDWSPDLKLLRVSKENGKFGLTYGIEAPGPIDSNKFEGGWNIEYHSGDWKKSVDTHRHWLEENVNLHEYNKHPHFPEWAADINFVLELWGARRGQKAMNTFPQMIDKIKEFAAFHYPENTLLYLPGFAENGIDSHAPDYNPSEQCGGEGEFKNLIDTAHDLGYKVMIHTNVLALTYTHPLFEEFRKYQVVDVFDRPQGWAMDMDGDWLTEPYFAYVNPGHEEWGDHMAGVFRDLISKYNIDSIFLDQTLLAFNVIKGPNFIEGMRNHVKRLQKEFPEILFAGEGLHEQNVEVLPFAQIHGIDSITDVHGMEGQAPWRTAHPVSKYLFGKYTMYTAHLLTKHPSHSMFKQQEKAYSELGVIPALCIYDNNQKIDLPEVHEMIARAGSL